MALMPHDTREAEDPSIGGILRPYLSRLFSNLQDMALSDKLVNE